MGERGNVVSDNVQTATTTTQERSPAPGRPLSNTAGPPSITDWQLTPGQDYVAATASGYKLHPSGPNSAHAFIEEPTGRIHQWYPEQHSWGHPMDSSIKPEHQFDGLNPDDLSPLETKTSIAPPDLAFKAPQPPAAGRSNSWDDDD